MDESSTDAGRGELRREHYEVPIRADLDAVWRMLTTGEGLAAWYGTDASVDLVPGGEVRIAWGDGESAAAFVDEVVPPRRLRLVYQYGDDTTGAEEWLLEHDRGVTHVRLIHALPDPGTDDWEGYYGDYRRGWRLFLRSLRFALEDAPIPYRRADARFVPAPAGRAASWVDLLVRVAGRDHVAAGDRLEFPTGEGADVLLVDAPHSLLLGLDSASLLADHEGAGEGLVLYLQAATHGADDHAAAGRRAALLDLIAADPGR